MAAFSSTPKTHCTSNDCKNVGIFKCEGCLQILCRQHANDHRDFLNHQLDEIVLEHDLVQQMVNEQKHEELPYNPLFEQIDRWEREAIMKIHQTASEVRHQIETALVSQRNKILIKLYEIAEQVRKARADDDFFENDINLWTDKLDKLKYNINNIYSTITIHEDSRKLILPKICISSIVQQSFEDEQFRDFHGNISIAENGRLAYHHGPKRSDAYVYGTQEYSSGKYKIRFLMNKKDSAFTMSFLITSKSALIANNKTDPLELSYGWSTNDKIHRGGIKLAVSKDLHDMTDEKTFDIELLIDCDDQKIIYFNEQTKNNREINIDITRCPLPWQLFFYLYDIEDSVKLLSSNRVF